MNQATWIIQVLDDSNNHSIEYSNRVWLRQNVERLHIHVCVEDCVATTSDIAKEWANKSTILIQEGKNIQDKSNSILKKRLYCSLGMKTVIWCSYTPQKNEKWVATATHNLYNFKLVCKYLLNTK